jgi:tetratricopeptide (TPR) repeat protein
LIGALTLFGCRRMNREQAMVEELARMAGPEERELSAEKIREIETEIQEYRREVDRTVQAKGQLGVYYKMLAVEYMRAGMFQAAYEALQQAIAVYPENPILFYYQAVCAARMAKAQALEEDRRRWLEISERLYRRALYLDAGYAAALYGLSVLYVFELDSPQLAETQLEQLLQVESKHIDGRFLLGQVYFSLGRLEEAIEIYGEIESLSDAREDRERAAANRSEIEEQLYGAQ